MYFDTTLELTVLGHGHNKSFWYIYIYIYIYMYVIRNFSDVITALF